jgi:hypothetical protein
MPLAKGNTTRGRPMPGAFVATCTQNTPGEYEISYAGRSESVKDAGSMGDHTCSEQLMKNAATMLLLKPDKTMPNCGELADRLEGIMNSFGLNNYSIFNIGLSNSQLLEVTEEDIAKNPDLANGMVCQERYNALKEHLEDLSTFVEQLRRQDVKSPAPPGLVAEAAEKYMGLVDDRPTAVNFSGVASGHGEPGVLAKLSDLEKSASIEVDKAKPFAKVIGLLDCKAVYQNAILFLKRGAVDAVLFRTSQEFVYFLSWAYPKVFPAILAHFGGRLDTLLNALKEVITDLATQDSKTQEQQKIDRQIGHGMNEEETEKLDREAKEGKFGRRKSERRRTKARRDSDEGYEEEEKEDEKID